MDLNSRVHEFGDILERLNRLLKEQKDKFEDSTGNPPSIRASIHACAVAAAIITE